MLNWTPYLESIAADEKYALLQELYTLTDVMGEKHSAKAGKFSLLNLRITTSTPEKEKKEEENEKKEELNVLDGLRKYATEHVLLVGRPGSGKSTALERLLLEMAQNPLSNEKIPVLIELRYYRTSILDLIKEFLHRHDHDLYIDREKLESLLRQRQFLLLFDGVNELPSEHARQDLHKFRKDFPETPMVFTTRDLRVGGDLEISKKLEMQPLTETQMEDFVRGYLPEVGEQMLLQLGGRLREFGQTPLFLWMLCSVFQSNQNNIPASLGYIFRSFTQTFDNQLKRYVPTSDDTSRDWWQRLLQHLAWVMTSPQTPLLQREGLNYENNNDYQIEIVVAISYDDAIRILTDFLREQGYHQPLKAEEWLKDLLKHHLIQIGADNKIEFRHQLIQEYYAAENLLQQISTLSDDELQWEYLNYLKWTEPLALLVGLTESEELALRVVKLALQVDWQLGARLAGAVKLELQEKSIDLIDSLGLPQLLEIHLLTISKLNAAIPKLIKFLKNEGSYIRCSAVYALGEIKSKQAVYELIKLLQDEDSSVYQFAVLTLEKIQSKQAVAELVKLIDNQDSYIRNPALYALGKNKFEQAIPELIKLFKDEDDWVRYKAVEALEDIQSDAVVPGLIKLLRDEDSLVREKAEDALVKNQSQIIVLQLIKVLEKGDLYVCSKSAVDTLVKINSEQVILELIKLCEHKYSDVRRVAAYTLGKIKSEIGISELIKLLEDKKFDVRESAAEALGKIKSKQSVPKLIELLKHQDYNIRIRAADALGKIKSEQATPELMKLLEDETSYLRSCAAYALGNIQSKQAVSNLIKILEDKDSDVRISAAHALGNIQSEQAIPALIKLLEDKDSDVRRSAVYALGKIQSEQAVPELIKLLDDKDSLVRRYVADALGEIKSKQSSSKLIELLEDKESYVRRDAILALGEIKSEQAVPKLIELLEDENFYIRRNAAYALGKIKSEQAILNLIKLLEDKDSDVRTSAAHALGEIKSEQAVPGLVKLLEDEIYPVPYEAEEALVKIKSQQAVPGLIKLLEHQDYGVRHRAKSVLTKIKFEQAIPELMLLLEYEDSDVRRRAVDVLVEIKSEVVTSNLIKALNNPSFIQANNGKFALDALKALAKNQEYFKYYKPVPTYTMSDILSHNYALVIGVGECEEPKLSLPVTVKDTQAIKNHLINPNLCGYINNDQHMRLLQNETATSENILNSLNWLQQQAEKDPEATVFIYYSGHGCLDESGEYYLIPHETDRVDVTNTALPAAKFNAALQQIRAKRLLVVIDSCHAQGMASSKDSINKNSRPSLPKGFTQIALPKNFINELKQGTGRVVFTSSTGNQSSWIRPDGAMSIYTYHFLEALRGAANQPGDKVVRVSHLMNHLGKTVPESAAQLCKAEQTPFFDFACEDFPVALLHGGKGLINQGNDQVRVESKTINLDSNTINELMEILKPFMESESSRRPFLILALGSQAPVLQRITWSGTVADFIPNMVDKLAGYGKVSSGKQALWVLLEYARSQVGIDVQQRIDELSPLINL